MPAIIPHLTSLTVFTRLPLGVITPRIPAQPDQITDPQSPLRCRRVERCDRPEEVMLFELVDLDSLRPGSETRDVLVREVVIEQRGTSEGR